MKNIKKHLSIFIVSCLVLVFTLFVPVAVYTEEQEKNIYLGYPVPFIIQNSPYSMVAKFSPAPAKYIVATQRETPTTVLGSNLLISLTLIFLVFEFIIYLVSKLQEKQKFSKYIGFILVANGLFFSVFIVSGVGFVLTSAGIIAIFLARIK